MYGDFSVRTHSKSARALIFPILPICGPVAIDMKVGRVVLAMSVGFRLDLIIGLDNHRERLIECGQVVICILNLVQITPTLK